MSVGSSPESLGARLREVAPRLSALEGPGRGQTARRFAELWTLGEEDLSLGRLGEAHADATAILREADRPDLLCGTWGVWAAEGPASTVTVTEQPSGAQLLTGDKLWCSGATILERALVSVRLPGGEPALAAVDLATDGVTVGRAEEWVSPAFAATGTRTVHFAVELPPDRLVGGPRWYLERPGFWLGAVGVAAVWAGGASGLVAELAPTWRDEPHARAHLGAADATIWSLRATLTAAAAEIDDAAGSEPSAAGRRRALRVRHLVDDGVTSVVNHVTRALGPGVLAHRADISRRIAELQLYVRQGHAERDLDQLGSLVADAARGGPAAVNRVPGGSTAHGAGVPQASS